MCSSDLELSDGVATLELDSDGTINKGVVDIGLVLLLEVLDAFESQHGFLCIHIRP